MKSFLIAALICVFGGSVIGQTCSSTVQTPTQPPKAEVKQITEKWEGVQAGFWFDVPNSTIDSKVCGVKLGMPVSSGNGVVKGFEWSLFCAATKHIEGLQWAMVGCSKATEVNGMQMAIVNVADSKLCGVQMGIVNKGEKEGVQLGIVNFADNVPCQFGLVNFNKNGWMPFMVFFNMKK